MPKRTEIICMHEGVRGHSVDPVFANAFLKAYNSRWVRLTRFVSCGGKSTLLDTFPNELKTCIAKGSDTALIVLADVDDNKHGCKDCEGLKALYWRKAQTSGITEEQFQKVVFVFPKDGIENWIEFLNTGTTDENQEGPKVEFSATTTAVKKLAEHCFCRCPARTSLPPGAENTAAVSKPTSMGAHLLRVNLSILGDLPEGSDKSWYNWYHRGRDERCVMKVCSLGLPGRCKAGQPCFL